MKICIVYGGTSREREISLKSGMSILKALSTQKNVHAYDFDGDYEKLCTIVKNVDIVFNSLHGGEGENGTIQLFFENNNIKFTGSGSIASKKAMNKHIAKKLCDKHNIQTPNWIYLDKRLDLERLDIFNNKSIVIKPSNEGSSIGLSIIKDFNLKNIKKINELNLAVEKCYQVSDALLIEEYIDGRELTASILGGKVLPILEIKPKNIFYDYECKYTKGRSEYIVPARISNNIELRIKEYAFKIFNILGCRHYGRVDFRLSTDNKIYFLELNTLPGFTNISLFPKSAMEENITYENLLLNIIDLATK